MIRRSCVPLIAAGPEYLTAEEGASLAEDTGGLSGGKFCSTLSCDCNLACSLVDFVFDAGLP